MERTAGMIHGTPDWQLDMMVEEDAARAWEALNAEPVKPITQISRMKRIQAWADIETAITADINNAIEWIAKAYNAIEDTPTGDRLAVIYGQLGEIKTDLLEIQKEIDGGELYK